MPKDKTAMLLTVAKALPPDPHVEMTKVGADH